MTYDFVEGQVMPNTDGQMLVVQTGTYSTWDVVLVRNKYNGAEGTAFAWQVAGLLDAPEPPPELN